jgi:periplasmic copper chaperone A
MTMRPLDQGLAIAPGQSVELTPGGFHLMFVDLESGLKQGEQVKGTLTFEKAGTVEVDFGVAAIGAESGAASLPPAGEPAGGDPHRHP